MRSVKDSAEKCSEFFGPGYRTPREATQAAREKLLYTVLVHCARPEKAAAAAWPDRLATIDADPASVTYSQIIHTLPMSHVGDELHHFGWNACSSCCNDASKQRRFLILLGLKSSRIYIVDTIKPAAPAIHKAIEPEELFSKANLSSPHTTHCLANGNILISCLGDAHGNAPGGFLLLNGQFEIIGKWGESEPINFNYDFWYQPYHNVMVSSEWSAPRTYEAGFNLDDVAAKKYGRTIHFWNWKEAKIEQSVDLGESGQIPLEVRFLHDPKSSHGFVGAALSSSIFHWFKSESENKWQVENVIQVEPVNVEGWPFPVPGLITDLLISMDDKFLYFSDWFHGDIRQYDITDPHRPRLAGQVWVGGLIDGEERFAKGKKLHGGPQMLQLSLDGQRLYVTNSLISSWDDQFYPGIAKSGSFMLRVDCDTVDGGLKVNEEFLVEFGHVDGEAFRAHEMRYPGGDSTSDIFMSFD